MKKNIYLPFFLFVSLLFFSCSKKNKVVVAPSPTFDIEVDQPVEVEDDRMDIEPIEKTSRVYRVVTIQKTGCYGNCPEYEFILLSNGEATYIGKENVARKGKFKAQAKTGFLFDIKTQISGGDFFKMETSYPANGKIIKDFPDTYILVSDDAHQIVIRNNYDAPQELLKFQQKIENIIEELEWVKVK